MKTNVLLMGALGTVLLALLFGGLGGCQQDSSSEPVLLPAAQPLGGGANAKQAAQLQKSRLVPWGHGAAQLTLRPAGNDEQLASGPSAVAIAADGGALVLDRLAGRIAHVDPAGTVRTATQVAVDAEDLCSSTDGFMAAFSPVRATAWLFDSNGKQAGHLKVPRSFRELLHVELGASNTLRVRTAYQELFEIGSPNHPLPLAVALRSKREGALLLTDGRGVVARVQSGKATLIAVQQASKRSGRAKLLASHDLPGTATAARIIGNYGDIVCARIEHASSPLPAAPYEGPIIEVARRAVCMSMSSGEIALDTALAPVGLYLPRRELAMGGGQLVFIHPEANGLRLQSWKLRGEVTP